MGLKSISAFSFSLLAPCRAMSARGLRVDERLRRERQGALTTAADAERQAVEPLITEIASKLSATNLYWKHKVCKTCRNGSKKRQTCAACSGIGKFSTFAFNLGSEKQLKDVLYNGLKLPKRTQDGKLRSDEEALQSLVALDKSGFVQHALRFAKLDTMRGIYERLAPGVDGRVRTVYNPAGTYTGRFNSSEAFYIPHSTNLQNLPGDLEAKRSPLYAVRDILVPEPGEVFVYADLSQSEARIVARLADDRLLIELWEQGRDIHKWTASAIYGCKEEEVTAEQRYVGKRARHALNYGEGANRFWRVVNSDADVSGVALTLTEAKRIHTAYHTLHPNLDAIWWDRVERMLRGDALLTNCFGRTCRFYPRIDWQTGEPDQETLRAMIAWEPQSTSVDCLNTGMLDLFRQEQGNGFRLLFQGHDSVLLGVDKHRVRHVARLAKTTLEREITVNGRSFVIPAEVFVGDRNWGEMERVL